jgi:thymidylate synthase (FAD)
MQIIDAKHEIILPYPDWRTAHTVLLQMIEKAGRTCYKSEDRVSPDSASRFVRNIRKHGHDAMLEHASLTVRFTVDRGVSHELVRHRVASFAQESTRYCNYAQEKFGNEITVIRPSFLDPDSVAYFAWKTAMENAEASYFALLEMGCTPEEARTVLPNSLKTEVVMTANMREWRHFFRLRALGETGKPHPQMQEVALSLLSDLQIHLPEIFEDLRREEDQ